MMIDFSNYNDENKDFSFTNLRLVVGFFESFKFPNHNSSLIKFEILQIKCKVTDIFKKVVRIDKKNLFSISARIKNGGWYR